MLEKKSPKNYGWNHLLGLVAPDTFNHYIFFWWLIVVHYEGFAAPVFSSFAKSSKIFFPKKFFLVTKNLRKVCLLCHSKLVIFCGWWFCLPLSTMMSNRRWKNCAKATFGDSWKSPFPQEVNSWHSWEGFASSPCKQKTLHLSRLPEIICALNLLTNRYKSSVSSQSEVRFIFIFVETNQWLVTECH